MKSESTQSVFRSPKWEIKPKLHRYPTKRWGHTAVLNKNKLFIYGGKTGKLKEPLYELDCDTFESHIHEIGGFPESRESHSCSLIKDKLIIWGGCRQEKTLNDCISITMKDRHCYWSQIAQFPTLKQRESHATTVLKDKYILLYGGSNQDEIYEDFWVFNTDLDVWFQVKSITGKMKKRLGCTLTTIRDKVYMFGGETEQENYESQLYRLTFSELQFCSKQRIPSVTCQKLSPSSSSLTPIPIPQGRSCHSAINYSDRYLIIIAGEGQTTDAKGKTVSVLLNDVWSYDTERGVWQAVEVPNRGIFKARSCFSANLYRNKIYIFGGLISTQNFKSSDQLLTLSFSQSTQKTLDMCNICKLHYRPSAPCVPQPLVPIPSPSRSSFQFALPNLYKISRLIRNPFDAICLIIEAYEKMGYREMTVDVIEGKIVMVQGSGVLMGEEMFGVVLERYQFVEEIPTEDAMIFEALEQRVEEQKLQIFGFNIKNACSRLGQNFILINRRAILVDVMLVTPENIFYCQINTEDNSVGAQQERSYEIIHNYMHKNNLNISLLENETFTVVVTDLQKVSPTQSQMKVNGKKFIEIAGSGKKINLQTYCSTLFLHKPALKLFINTKPIQFRDQQLFYKNCTFESTSDHDLKSIRIRQSDKQSPIYIYRGGVRAGHYTHKTTPYIEGYVEISLSYELNLLRTRVESMKALEGVLMGLAKEFKEGYRKRRSNLGVDELENGTKLG